MVIVHICLCDPYNEKWGYHRNILSEQNKKDGHDVYIITNEYEMDEYGGYGKRIIGKYNSEMGIKIIRLKNKFILPFKVQSKVNTVKKMYNTLAEISPDIIMVHNLQTFNLKQIIKYKRKNRKVLLLGDSHAAYCNSARNAISSMYHKRIFGPLIRKYISYFDKFYFIAKENYDFFSDIYGVELEDINVEALPARFVNNETKKENKAKVRKKYGLTNELLFVHSGKMNSDKKTLQLLNILSNRKEEYKLLLIGSLSQEIKEQVLHICNVDQRIEYLGWMDSYDLSLYISAADLYLQPGSQSISFQSSLAAGTPVLIYPHAEYMRFYNGWEFCVESNDDINTILDCVFENPEILHNKVQYAYETAYRFFDCSKFAFEMYSMHRVLTMGE